MSLTGEALLSATGILAALEPGPVKPTAAILRRADRVPDAAKERLAEYVAANQPAKAAAPAPFDYDRMLELLTEPVTDARARENVAGWQNQVLAEEYAAVLGRAWGYLQQAFPVKIRENLVGAQNVTPPGLEVARFRRILAVVEDPLSIVARMQEGAMPLAAELEALETCYPALTALMRQQVKDVLVDHAAEHKGWVLPRRKDRVLRVFLRANRASAEGKTAGDVKKLYDEKRDAAEKQAPQAPTKPDTDGELTKAQRLEVK